MPVRFRNIQLGNRWLESLDYASRQTSLNGAQSYLDRDGIYRFVLAHADPGVPNWLDVAGHPRGTIFMRWNKPRGGDAGAAERVRRTARRAARVPAGRPPDGDARRARTHPGAPPSSLQPADESGGAGAGSR